jgi:hypothetical protein
VFRERCARITALSHSGVLTDAQYLLVASTYTNPGDTGAGAVPLALALVLLVPMLRLVCHLSPEESTH